MGNRRLFGRAYALILSLVPLFTLAQWDQSDSDTLFYINAKLTTIRDEVEYISGRQSNIARDVGTIMDDVSYLYRDFGAFVSTQEKYLRSISNAVSKLSFDGDKNLKVHDEALNDSVSDLDTTMHRVLAAVNNLTNYMCYSPEYSCTFNSNMVALLSTYVGRVWPYATTALSPQLQYVTIETLISQGQYQKLFQQYGLWQAFLFPYLSSVYYQDLPSSMQAGVNSQFKEIWGIASVPSRVWQKTANLSGPYYYQYGTREFTDSFLEFNDAFTSFTNMMSVALEPENLPPVEKDEHGNVTAFSGSFFQSASGLASSATNYLDLGITERPATNPIVNLEDAGYSSQGNSLTASSFDNSGVKGVVDGINDGGFVDDLSAALDNVSPSDFQFTFNIGNYDLRGASIRAASPRPLPRQVRFTIHDVRNQTNNHVYFFCSFLEVIMSLFFIALGWNTFVRQGVYRQ